jgi:malonate decarboxylase epsilon subunit
VAERERRVIAFLFPGQGAQSPGFLHALGGAAPHPEIRKTIEEASDVLHLDVLALDRRDALESTVAVQIGLVVAGVAAVRALGAQGLAPDAVAGLSVGAYGAAVACEAISFSDALRLVQLRAQLMERAWPRGYGMMAVVGLSEREVEVAVEASDAGVYVGNLNAPRQIVVSGSDAGLERLRVQALKQGARKVERLAVSVPSHCILLEDAARELIAAASQIPFKAPAVPYIGNRGARPLRTADAIRDDLATNLRYPVRWHESTILLAELGVDMLVEMPPGRTLTQLADEALPEISKVAVEQASIASVAARIVARLK